MDFRSKMKKVNCPDGTPRFVYKNLDDAFKLELKDWSGGIAARLENLLQKFETNVEFEKHISGLLVEFDEVNRSLQIHFRGLYSAYANNPCNLDKWYAEEVHLLIHTEFKLRLKKIRESAKFIENELVKHTSDQKDMVNIIAESTKKLGRLSACEKAKQEFQTALDDFRKWRTRR